MGYFIQAIGLISSLALLVIFHEGGHFFFAKLFKTRVEKFYLFFDPWFSLFKFKKGDTEYGIGWIPLGGYVKISGMIDESMDREALKQPPQPWEFRSKSAYQRLLIMLGGVLVNFILALFIYVFVLYVWGEEYLPMENAKYGIYCDSLALDMGLKQGDLVLKVDTVKIEKFVDLMSHLVLDNPKTVTVKRDGNIETISVPNEFHQKLIANEKSSFISPRVPFVVDSVMEGLPADSAGVKKNDKIIGINDLSTPYYQDFAMTISDFTNKEVDIRVLRNNQEKVIRLTVSKECIIGVYNKAPDSYFDFKVIEYDFVEAIPAGISMGVEKLSSYVRQMKLIFTKEGVKKVGGFGAIGGLFSKTWDWRSFWYTTALLSVILAFMNILPIPALDGGHVLFLLVEIITGRKPGDKFLEYAQIVGMVLLLALLVYANGNDLLGCVRRM